MIDFFFPSLDKVDFAHKVYVVLEIFPFAHIDMKRRYDKSLR